MQAPQALELSLGMPEQLGCYVYANHSHDVVTGRSVTGIIILLNSPMGIKTTENSRDLDVWVGTGCGADGGRGDPRVPLSFVNDWRTHCRTDPHAGRQQ
jgi:hypothetical protein